MSLLATFLTQSGSCASEMNAHGMSASALTTFCQEKACLQTQSSFLAGTPTHQLSGLQSVYPMICQWPICSQPLLCMAYPSSSLLFGETACMDVQSVQCTNCKVCTVWIASYSRPKCNMEIEGNPWEGYWLGWINLSVRSYLLQYIYLCLGLCSFPTSMHAAIYIDQCFGLI